MNRPIRSSLIAVLLLAPPAYSGTVAGAPGVLLKLVAVFFACVFVLLMALHLFYNRKWRIDPGPRWRAPVRRDTVRGLTYPTPG